MKKAILIVLVALVLVIPAYAAEGDPATDQPIQQEQEPVVVATLDELQAAIEAAGDGDTIMSSKKIDLNNVSLICTKDITIRGGTDNHCFFSISGDCELSGLKILSDDSRSTFALIESIGNKVCNVKINDCQFIRNGNNDVFNNTFLINIFSGNVEFKNCKFLNEESTTLSISSAATVNIENCFFAGTHTLFAGGAIYNSGHLAINNSKIADNSSGLGGAIYNDGSLSISNSIIKGNVGKNEFDVVEGNDIYSCGVLTITDEQSADSGFYEETTGEKLALPLVDYTGIARLTYLTVEQAAEYFAPKPGDDGNGSGENTLPEQPQPPQEPGDQTGDDDTTGGEQPPQEPTQPPEGEGTNNPDNPDSGDQNTPQQPEQPPHNGNEDDPTDTPPQPPEQPTEPPQDDTPDKPADTTPDTPQPPQKPSDSDNSGDDNYTSPVGYRPSQRPIWPVVTVKPTEDNKPQDQPENNPTPAKPQLACNGAVIDTSRTVVLLGYGDGLLHEGDPLTRAQMATVIYRLLDDESIALYSNTQVAFTDVAADAWYAPYVRVIQAAGIVNGVGDGKYDPEGLLTWGQALTILSRFVEPQEYTLQHIQYSGWALQSIKTTVANGWIRDSVAFNPDAVISRGQLEQLINGVLALYR